MSGWVGAETEQHSTAEAQRAQHEAQRAQHEPSHRSLSIRLRFFWENEPEVEVEGEAPLAPLAAGPLAAPPPPGVVLRFFFLTSPSGPGTRRGRMKVWGTKGVFMNSAARQGGGQEGRKERRGF